MAEIEKKWYVIRAISGKEKKVKELLELEIDRHKFMTLPHAGDQVNELTQILSYHNQIVWCSPLGYQVTTTTKTFLYFCRPAHEY